jgi:hypothetical protein
MKVVVEVSGMLNVAGSSGERSLRPVAGTAAIVVGGLMYTAWGSSTSRGGPFTKRSGCAW